VLVVVDPADYGMVVSGLDGGWSVTLRYVLMLKAFSHTAEYDATISRTLLGWSDDEFRPTIEPANRLEVAVDQLRRLRYGENPHQPAALYKSHIGLRPWDVLQGKELSYTNVLDLDAAVRIALEFMEPAAVVIKHTNPCGVATADSVAEAYVAARDADPLSAFGGIVGLNRPVDTASADAIVSTFIEAVIAPGVDEAARMILAKKANMRVLTTDFATLAAETVRPDEELRSTLAGVLMQARDRVTEAHDPWPQGDFPKVATKRAPTAGEWKALRFAWRVCAHVKSNAVVFTGPQRTLAIGAGQMSRVDAVNVAVAKARTNNRSLQGSVAASDAFFPFRDGLDAIARAGATAVVQPGGSVRDAEVVAAADEHGIAMVFAGRRHFRH
jgi:phosphoribosylaminoimidazolecarboxamide formyltransferase/IMP cyclohydrolase